MKVDGEGEERKGLALIRNKSLTLELKVTAFIKIVITVCSTKWNSSATTRHINAAAGTTQVLRSIAMI